MIAYLSHLFLSSDPISVIACWHKKEILKEMTNYLAFELSNISTILDRAFFRGKLAYLTPIACPCKSKNEIPKSGKQKKGLTFSNKSGYLAFFKKKWSGNKPSAKKQYVILILGIVEMGGASNEIRFPDLFLLQFHLPPLNMLCWTRNFFHDRWGSVFVFPSNILPKKFKKANLCNLRQKHKQKQLFYFSLGINIASLPFLLSLPIYTVSHQRGFVIVANSKIPGLFLGIFLARERKREREKKIEEVPV